MGGTNMYISFGTPGRGWLQIFLYWTFRPERVALYVQFVNVAHRYYAGDTEVVLSCILLQPKNDTLFRQS